MIKEYILTIVISALLAFGITGGYLSIHQKSSTTKINKNTAIITEPTLVPTVANQPTIEPKKDSLEVTSPENNILLSTEKTTIIGTTTVNSNIIIATAKNTFTGKSDNNGKFEIPITLETGLNIIKISSIDSSNNQKDTTINITYSTAKI